MSWESWAMPPSIEDGNVSIQENTTDELLVFSAVGDLLHRTGGTGDGPEEFRGIRRFDRDGSRGGTAAFRVRRK